MNASKDVKFNRRKLGLGGMTGGVMTPAAHYTVCLPRVLNSVPGKQLRSAHDSAASPTVMACSPWDASVASCRAASATQIRVGTAKESWVIYTTND